MLEKSRQRLLAGGLVMVGAVIFGVGINWGLPSHAIDPYLFGTGTESATKAVDAYRLSGVGISRLAGDWDQNSNLPADVAAHPINDRSNPVTLLENRRGRAGGGENSKDDVNRARILRRYRLYSAQPDEMISFRALAMMHPGKFEFDPKLYQYGGLWIYPLGAIVKVASLLGFVTVSNDPTFYLDSPETFGRFYILGRAYSAAWGLVGVLAVFAIVRRAGGRLFIAFLAGLGFICMPVVLDLAHEAKPHLAGTALMLLAILAASKYVETGRWKWIVWTAIACGACAGMVLSGVLSVIILAVMLVQREMRIANLAKFAAGIAIAAAVYFAANPYVAIHLVGDPSVLKANLANSQAMYSFSPNIASALKLVLVGASLSITVFGMIGIAFWLFTRTEKENGLRWLLFISAALVLVQFTAYAGNKPGEYARFALLPDTVLLLAAFIAITHFVRKISLQALAGIIVVALTIAHSAAYEAGFIKDNSRMLAAADIEGRLAKAGDSPVLYITAEPAPYCLPPVNLFRWRIVLLPADGRLPAGSEAGIVVKPDTRVHLSDPTATPISWANMQFDVAEVGGK